jgi:hypothetical protein
MFQDLILETVGDYAFSVKARNVQGDSAYCQEQVRSLEGQPKRIERGVEERLAFHCPTARSKSAHQKVSQRESQEA